MAIETSSQIINFESWIRDVNELCLLMLQVKLLSTSIEILKPEGVVLPPGRIEDATPELVVC